MQQQEQATPDSGMPETTEKTACCSLARWWWLGILGLVVAAYAAYMYWSDDGERARAVAHAAVGRPVPPMRFAPLLGTSDEVSTDTLRGSVAVINFWGTWCPPCRAEFPHLVALAKQFASEPRFRLIAVSCGTNVEHELREETEDFLKRINAELAVYWDPNEAARSAVNREIGFEGYPTTLVVDAAGVVRGVFVGYTPGDEMVLKHLVQKLLGEATGEPSRGAKA